MLSILAAQSCILDKGLANLVLKVSIDGDVPTCIFSRAYLSCSWKVSLDVFSKISIIVIFPLSPVGQQFTALLSDSRLYT